MSETLGFDVDLAKTSPEDRKAMANAIALYKRDLRSVVGNGDLYRLESPYDSPRSALDYVSPDKTRAVLFVYQLKDSDLNAVKVEGIEEFGAREVVALKGLDPQRRYRVREVNLPEGVNSQLRRDGQVTDGATLMRDGIVPPCNKEFDSAVVELGDF